MAQITKKLVLREIEGNTKNKCECEEWGGNAGAGNLDGKAKNVGNPGGYAGNQGWNRSVAVERT